MRYSYSAGIAALSEACIGPSPRTKIFLFLPSICTEEVLSTPKIITFFPSLPSVYEKCKSESNPMP